MAEDPPWDPKLGKAVEEKIAEMKDLVPESADSACRGAVAVRAQVEDPGRDKCGCSILAAPV